MNSWNFLYFVELEYHLNHSLNALFSIKFYQKLYDIFADNSLLIKSHTNNTFVQKILNNI